MFNRKERESSFSRSANDGALSSDGRATQPTRSTSVSMAATPSEVHRLSATSLGKRKRVDHSTRHVNGHTRSTAPSAGVAALDRLQLCAAFEFIDCHGIFDLLFTLPGSRIPVSLRQAIAVDAHSTLRVLIEEAYASASVVREELPLFPYDPAEPQYRGMKKRTPEEIAIISELAEERQGVADRAAKKTEDLDHWLSRARALVEECGRRAIPAEKSDANSDTTFPSGRSKSTTSGNRCVLHRALAGIHDVFSSVNTDAMRPHTLELLSKVGDTDAMTSTAVHIGSQWQNSSIHMSDISPPPVFNTEMPDPAQLGASDAFGVEFLNYGAYDSYAPMYDSARSAPSYKQSVDIKKRQNGHLQQRNILEGTATLTSIQTSLPRNIDALGDLINLPASRLLGLSILLQRLHFSQTRRHQMSPSVARPTTAEASDADSTHKLLVELLCDASAPNHIRQLDSGSLRSLHPPAKRLGFYGMMNAQNPKAVREGVLQGLPPAK